MLKLTTQDVTLKQVAEDKVMAIRNIASDLANKGFVELDYVDGMLNREQQSATFLGNGIAIPHGTTDTRNLVKTTGITVHHFPNGVNWGDDNIVYIAIGIAAKSDEHLDILKQLTKVLSVDGVEEKLKQASTQEDIVALLNGDVQFSVDFDLTLIQKDFPIKDMTQLSALAGGLLKNANAVDTPFVSNLIGNKPSYLGGGLWLNSGKQSVQRTAMSLITVLDEFNYNGKPVKGLITLSVCNNAHKEILNTLGEWVYQKKQSAILQASEQELLTIFNGDKSQQTNSSESSNVAVFKIKNAHGLHARPGAMLVAEAKKFESAIKVRNLNGEDKLVNAKSLMKVIALGVKHGHELEFSAEGIDAAQAISSIGSAIESGLGEG